MSLMIELSGEQLEFASQEALAAASILAGEEPEVVSQDGPALVLDVTGVSAADLAVRLGLAHHVSDRAISGTVEAAGQLAGSVDIGAAGSFRVRVRRSEVADHGVTPKELEVEAGRILSERTGARVDLGSPEIEVRLLLARRAYAGILGGSVDRKAMEARAVRHRPFFQPVSIHPKFARAMVNLARVHEGGTVMDPFCGTGGILIEVALLGYRARGSDIDPRMVQGSGRNLASLGLEADLRVSDVADAYHDAEGRVEAIVTDPPYGRSTALHGSDTEGVTRELYSMAADAIMPGGRLVVCLPSRDLLPRDGDPFEVVAVHPMRVHKSLTRHVCVLLR